MAKRGAVKPKQKITFKWSFLFWDIEPGSALPRGQNLAGKGFEKQSKKVKLSLTDQGFGPGSAPVSAEVKQLKETEIRALTDAKNTGLFDLHIEPPAGHDSVKPAGPEVDSPKDSALWNKSWQIQFRPATWSGLEVDAEGFFVVDGDDEFVPCTVPRDLKDAGVPPHMVLRIFQPQGSGEERNQRVECDVRFDVLRPTDKRKTNKGGIWLEDRVGKRSESGISFDRLFVVIHCTGHVPEDDRPTKKPDWRIGTSYIGTQLQTLTARASIHYLVNIDGHVVKIVEEDKSAHQAGFDPRTKDQKKADKTAGITKNPYGGGWRDFVFARPPKDDPDAVPTRNRFARGARIRANQPSIGIEHVAGANNPWPQAQIDGSVRLVREILDFHQIKPCDVVRHRDLCFKAKKSTTGHELKTHHLGKLCPGDAVPWASYQDEKVALWPVGEIPDEKDQKLNFQKADIYGGVFEFLTNLGDTLSGAAATEENLQKQADAISQLQDEIERIGYWCLTKDDGNRGKYDEAVTHCVRMIQERFMKARGVSVSKEGAMDFDTAVTIQRIVAHGPDNLP